MKILLPLILNFLLFNQLVLAYYSEHLSYSDDEDYSFKNSEEELKEEGRFIIPLFNTNFLPDSNITTAAAFIAALASSLMSLLTLAGFGLLVAASLGGGAADLGQTSYGTSYRSMMDNFELNWETLSLVDWLSLVQDTWTNFSPTNLDCQKRFICEIHRKKKELGPVAESMTYLLSYLKYGEVMRLPEVLKSLVEDYSEAADIGSLLQKDCGTLYSDCNFSVTKAISTYILNTTKHNEEPKEPDTTSSTHVDELDMSVDFGSLQELRSAYRHHLPGYYHYTATSLNKNVEQEPKQNNIYKTNNNKNNHYINGDTVGNRKYYSNFEKNNRGYVSNHI